MNKYEDIKQQTLEMPKTFIPGIIATICEEAVRKKVFNKTGLKHFIEKVSIKTAESLACGCVSDHQGWKSKGFNYCPICGEYLRGAIFT